MNKVNSLEELSNLIAKGVNPNWSNLKKIRYVYLYVGKYLTKNTDFFLSADGKLKDFNLSSERLKELYNSLPTVPDQDWYKVICRSAAGILQYCLDKIGIKSTLMKSTDSSPTYDKSIDIHHWFLAVEDGSKTYFVSLAADLANIQNGLKTEHFGSYISYEKKDQNGNQRQVYEGEKIEETLITQDMIDQIDLELGYRKNNIILNNDLYLSQTNIMKKGTHWVYDNFFLDYILYSQKNNKWFWQTEGEKTTFYNEIYQAIPYNLLTATPQDYQYFIDQIISLSNVQFNLLIDKLARKYSEHDKQKSIKDLKTEIIKLVCEQELPNEFKNDIELINLRSFLRDIKIFTYNKIPAFINKIRNATGSLNEKDIRQIKDTIQDIITSVSFYFIDNPSLLKKKYNNEISNAYLATKFLAIFGQIFNCNNNIEDFNNLSYSEQKEIFLKVIPLIFEDDHINQQSAKNRVSGYKFDMSVKPILNIIRSYTIKNINDDSYSIIFHFPHFKNENEIFIMYDIKNNKLELLKPTELIVLQADYMIISETLNNRIKDIENIERRVK